MATSPRRYRETSFAAQAPPRCRLLPGLPRSSPAAKPDDERGVPTRAGARGVAQGEHLAMGRARRVRRVVGEEAVVDVERAAVVYDSDHLALAVQPVIPDRVAPPAALNRARCLLVVALRRGDRLDPTTSAMSAIAATAGSSRAKRTRRRPPIARSSWIRMSPAPTESRADWTVATFASSNSVATNSVGVGASVGGSPPSPIQGATLSSG